MEIAGSSPPCAAAAAPGGAGKVTGARIMADCGGGALRGCHLQPGRAFGGGRASSGRAFGGGRAWDGGTPAQQNQIGPGWQPRWGQAANLGHEFWQNGWHSRGHRSVSRETSSADPATAFQYLCGAATPSANVPAAAHAPDAVLAALLPAKVAATTSHGSNLASDRRAIEFEPQLLVKLVCRPSAR